jgi:hypothetical protein
VIQVFNPTREGSRRGAGLGQEREQEEEELVWSKREFRLEEQ